MQTAAQLNGVSAHHATLALTPESLVFAGRAGSFGRVERSLALADIVRVEAHHADEAFNLQIWTDGPSWRLHVFAPLVWRFAIEDALRRLGRPVARFQDAQAGSGRRPRLSGVPTPRGIPTPRVSGPDSPVHARHEKQAVTATREAGESRGDGSAAPLRPVVEATLRIGERVPVRLSIEMPGGGRMTVRLVGEVESIEPGGLPRPATAQGDGQSGARADDRADLPVLRVHI